MIKPFSLPLPLLKILAITGINHDGTLPSIVEATQKQWLRSAACERWEMGDQFEELRAQLVPLFMQLGMLDEIRPTKSEYDYVVVLGDTASEFRTRLASALRFYQKGVRFGKLVIHVGARPLDPEMESKAVLIDRNNLELPIRADWQEPIELPKTEAEMARMIFDQAQLPAGFDEHVKVEIVDAPMQKNIDGSLRRPNTGDVARLWLSGGVKPGSILAVSYQPYVMYQDAVLKAILPRTFTVETVGTAALIPLRMGEILDTLARWLYVKHLNASKTL